MKKLVSLMCVVMLALALSVPAFAHGSEPVVTDTAGCTDIMPRIISINDDFTVKIGKSWSTMFRTYNGAIMDAHDAFKVIVSGVSGSYKIIIENSNGWTYSTPEITNASRTVTVTNVNGDDFYYVYVMNTGDTALTGNVKISSYYNS